jgi:hypothetical protein
MDPPGAALAEFEKTGDIKWATELSRVPETSGTQNVSALNGPRVSPSLAHLGMA